MIRLRLQKQMNRSGKLFVPVPGAILLAVPHGLVSTACAQTNTNAAAADKPRPTLTDLFGDPVVAKGKGFEIKQSQLDAEIVRAKTPYAAQGQAPPPSLDWQVLDRIVGVQLLLNQATDEDRAKGKEQFEKSLEADK